MGQLWNLWTIGFLIVALPVVGQHDITGHYSSSFTDMGTYATAIQLKKDSTFKYALTAHLTESKGTGTYRVSDDKIIYLTFHNDSLSAIQKALVGSGIRLTQLLYEGGRLYEISSDGEIIRRARGLSRHKRFLFFGERYWRTKKSYLKKRKGNLIWLVEENASRQQCIQIMPVAFRD